MEMHKNSNNKKIQVWLPLLFALVMVAGMTLGYLLRGNSSQTRGILMLPGKRSPLQEVVDLVNAKYVDPITDTLNGDMAQAMLAKLDPHSVFIPAADLSEINEDLQGNFQGIGVEFQIFNDTVNVINVLQGGPSEKAGLQVGDKFVKVGDSVVAGNKITNARIRNLLRGPGASKVLVTMMRNGKLQQFTINRGLIPIPSIDASYKLDSSTGYIRINKFSETTYEEFMSSLEKLQKQHISQLVLDLRGNGGGILTEAVDIADEFLDGNKLIVYTQGDKMPRQEYRCKRDGIFEKGKLVVLVDENSASASEVLTGALQDWDRATIVGRRTFGKGLVQEQYDLSDGAALRLTVARYYTPSGRSIQKPYTHDGNGEYGNDLLKRYQHGELVNADSNKVQNGKAYQTKSGRTVYGGGGIMPDIFVPFDTSVISASVNKVLSRTTVSNFVYQYYIQNKSELSAYRSGVEFAQKFNKEEDMWNAFANFASKDSLSVNSISTKDKDFLKDHLKALLGRQIWRTEGLYEILNADDEMVRKALEAVKK
jgi:carboxyl-terminal processing protease